MAHSPYKRAAGRCHGLCLSVLETTEGNNFSSVTLKVGCGDLQWSFEETFKVLRVNVWMIHGLMLHQGKTFYTHVIKTDPIKWSLGKNHLMGVHSSVLKVCGVKIFAKSCCTEGRRWLTVGFSLQGTNCVTQYPILSAPASLTTAIYLWYHLYSYTAPVIIKGI